ncbi:ester cyclase [Niveibacterium sp. SC-1]|uniref:ester cyclase n=1 Tax=Niveibacterium sp. SC-1 TaxID=3135646 RepID=UPI00311FC171
MSELSEHNKQLAERWIKHCWDGNPDTEGTIEELLGEEAVGFLEGVIVRGLAEFRGFRDTYLTAIPNVRLSIESMVAEGAWVAVRWRAQGELKGPLMGIPPSGKSIDVVGSTWLRFQGDKIVEGHDTWNQGAVLAYLADSPAGAGYLPGERRRIPA